MPEKKRNFCSEALLWKRKETEVIQARSAPGFRLHHWTLLFFVTPSFPLEVHSALVRVVWKGTKVLKVGVACQKTMVLLDMVVEPDFVVGKYWSERFTSLKPSVLFSSFSQVFFIAEPSYIWAGISPKAFLKARTKTESVLFEWLIKEKEAKVPCRLLTSESQRRWPGRFKRCWTNRKNNGVVPFLNRLVR